MSNLVINSQKMSTPTRSIFPDHRVVKQYAIPLGGPITPTTRRRIVRPPTPFNFARLATSSDNESEEDSAGAIDREVVYAVPPLYDFEYSGYEDMEPRKRKRSSPEPEGSNNPYTVSKPSV